MPRIARILSPARHRLANSSIGVPPPTVPLNRRKTLLYSASSVRAGMAKANGPLLVVTTCLPVLNALVICERAGSPVLMLTGVTSTTTSASTDSITSSAGIPGCPNSGSADIG